MSDKKFRPEIIDTAKELKPSAPDAVLVEGKVFNKATKQEIAEWVTNMESERSRLC